MEQNQNIDCSCIKTSSEDLVIEVLMASGIEEYTISLSTIERCSHVYLLIENEELKYFPNSEEDHGMEQLIYDVLRNFVYENVNPRMDLNDTEATVKLVNDKPVCNFSEIAC